MWYESAGKTEGYGFSPGYIVFVCQLWLGKPDNNRSLGSYTHNPGKGKSEPKDRFMEYFAFSSFMLIMVFLIFAFSAVVGTIVMLPVLLVSRSWDFWLKGGEDACCSFRSR